MASLTTWEDDNRVFGFAEEDLARAAARLKLGDFNGYQIENPASSNSLTSIHFKSCQSPRGSISSSASASSLELEECQPNCTCKLDEGKVLEILCNSLWAMACMDSTEEGEGPFSAKTAPKTPLLTYVQRISNYVNDIHEAEMKEAHGEPDHCMVSPAFCAMVMTLVYVDRALGAQADFKITKYNVHRIVLAGIVIATKTLRDKSIPNRFMAKIGGVPVEKLNEFEVELFRMLNFNVYICTEEFVRTLGIIAPCHQ